MSGGKWTLCHGDRCLYYSYATATEGNTPCPISGCVSHTLFNIQLPYNKKYLQKVTEMEGQGWRHTYKGTVIECKRDSD